jgi:hypothetical protein
MATQNKEVRYSEADLILELGLERIVEYTDLMKEWLAPETQLNKMEEQIFDKILLRAKRDITGWQEEDLKMKFLSPILELSNLMEGENFQTYFEKTVSATVENHFLKVKTDFMMASGVLDKPQNPYFHFQEWKPHKKPTGDSMAQLIEALLIGQEVNNHEFPMYGCEVVGKHWTFVILTGKTYCISESFDCTKRHELFKIVSVLRKFREILDERLAKKKTISPMR